MGAILIEGQYPNVEWSPNREARRRNLDEAIEIARRHGVDVPHDVAFFIDEFGDLGTNTTARGPRITKPAGAYVVWTDFVQDRTGKVPFLLRADILESDEAIVAVLAHEMFELRHIRDWLAHGTITVEDLIAQVSPGIKGNLHDQAWDKADAMVLRMRGQIP